MSVARLVARPDRISQFLSVSREEGLRVALAKARRQIGHAWRGQVPSAVPAARVSAGPRFARTGLWRDLARKDAFTCATAPAVLRATPGVAMIGDLNLPQCRKYRVEQLDEVFGLAGADYRFSHYEDIPRCLDSMQTASHLVLYRVARNDLVTMYLYEARRLRLPVLYDIDDPLFSLPAYETYSNMNAVSDEMKAHFLSEAPLFLDVMSMADVLSFSTPGLAAHAGAFLPRESFVRRNFADRQTLEAGAEAVRNRQDDGGFTMAIASGSRGHSADFRPIADVIWSILDGHPDRRLKVLGHMDALEPPEELRGQIEHAPFSDYQTYLGQLARAHCALMPLTDDIFNRCKSAVRVIDAASVGVPSIVSDVGDLSAPILDRATGFVAKTHGDWRRALEVLADDKQSARRMGHAARTALETDWSAGLGQPVIDPGLVDWVRST